jgi:hypothetical protein
MKGCLRSNHEGNTYGVDVKTAAIDFSATTEKDFETLQKIASQLPVSILGSS